MALKPSPDASLRNSKELSEVLTAIQENLSKSLSKNDSLLEAIESSELRASQTGSNEVALFPFTTPALLYLYSQAPLLRNLRARLAAAHAPYSALKRDLSTFAGEMLCTKHSIWGGAGNSGVLAMPIAQGSVVHVQNDLFQWNLITTALGSRDIRYYDAQYVPCVHGHQIPMPK